MSDTSPPAQLSLPGAEAMLLPPRAGEGPGLADLDALPVGDHVGVFTSLHERLQDELALLDVL